MKDLLKEIFASIPKYISNFAKVSTGPKTFIASRNIDQESALTEALTFAGISFALAMILITPRIPDDVDFWKFFATRLISNLILIACTAGVLRLAWKIVGGQASFDKFLIVYSYYFGVTFLMFFLVILCSDGVLKSFNPELYKKLIAIQQKQSTEIVNPFQSASFIASLLIFVAGFVLVSIWAFIGWGAYRLINQASKAQSVAAFFLTGVLTWPTLIIYYFIQAALSK